MTATFVRHVGKINNTGSRVIVVFREVPNDAEYCLVVESDRLPDLYHQNMMTIVNSKEAQDDVDLFNVLSRRTFGTGEPVLETLHQKGFLRKELVSNISMMPLPNMPYPLAGINKQIKEDAAVKTTSTPTAPAVEQKVDLKSEDVNALIDEAKKLEERAVALRERAYMVNPELRPKRGRPGLSDADKEARRQERNRRRRENYKNVTKAKEAIG